MIFSVSRSPRRRAVAAALAATLLGGEALAQDNTTLPKGLENFSLTPGNQVAPTEPEPAPRATPLALPPVVRTQPAPATTPAPAPSQAASPRIAPAQPAPGARTADPALPPALPDPPLPAEPLGDPPANASAGVPPPGTGVPVPAAIPDEVIAASGEESGAMQWIVLALVLALVLAFGGAVAALVLRRRRRARDTAHWERPDGILFEPGNAPIPIPAPAPTPMPEAPAQPTAPTAAAAPAAPPVESAMAATVAMPGGADRPWLEFALRPVKAGTNVVDAVVEFELTVANGGAVVAEDVRIAAWLLSASPNQDADIARFLESPPAEAVMAPIAIAPGDGKRVDATIALPKSGLHVVTARDRPFFVPMIVADARYRLPDGAEGRTSAAFVIGTVKAGTDKLGPVWLDRGPRLHDRVEARLHGAPARA